jgi:hypothetical protein
MVSRPVAVSGTMGVITAGIVWYIHYSQVFTFIGLALTLPLRSFDRSTRCTRAVIDKE